MGDLLSKNNHNNDHLDEAGSSEQNLKNERANGLGGE